MGMPDEAQECRRHQILSRQEILPREGQRARTDVEQGHEVEYSAINGAVEWHVRKRTGIIAVAAGQRKEQT
jgi:hypothetical protein